MMKLTMSRTVPAACLENRGGTSVASRLGRRCDGRACMPLRPAVRQTRRVPVKTTASGSNDGPMARIAKQVRDSLPIIGLISRLTTPEGIGGKDIQTYPEFCRDLLEKGSPEFNSAMVRLEKMGTTQTAERRFITICLWMSKSGAGILDDGWLAKAGLRLPITRDIEAEMERFEMDYTAIRTKFKMMEAPKADSTKGAILAIDSISSCCFGVKQSDGLPDGAASVIATVVSTVFPDVAREIVEEAILMRPSRKYT